jgi:hypothetical protein
MKRSIIDPNKSYTFSDYFELNIPIYTLTAYFGYQHTLMACTLPQTSVDMSQFAHLKTQLETNLKYIYLSSEAARREALVAPILFSVAAFLKTYVNVEFSLEVSKQLKGKIDYFIQRHNQLLVIEAKHDDLDKGFKQLTVELIAVDQWLDQDITSLYGIITLGEVWRFGILDRNTKLITQDTNLYRVPADLQELLGILIAILEGKESNGNATK